MRNALFNLCGRLLKLAVDDDRLVLPSRHVPPEVLADILAAYCVSFQVPVALFLREIVGDPVVVYKGKVVARKGKVVLVFFFVQVEADFFHAHAVQRVVQLPIRLIWNRHIYSPEFLNSESFVRCFPRQTLIRCLDSL